MNRSSFIMCSALLVLVLGPGACSTAGSSNSDLIADSHAETGVSSPVVVVRERPGVVPGRVVVATPALRLEVEETTVRLVVPGLVEIEISGFGPSVGFVD